MSDAEERPPAARASEDGLAVGTIIGARYRVERQIGEGGMATVFLAQDLKHHRPVAVKVLLQTLTDTIGVRRFLQEIEVIAGLQHPHLLTLIDSGDVNGMPYYVMPYIEAQTLHEVIQVEKPMPVERAVTIAREVADGLAYAHQHGVLHRDVKPSNVLMSDGHAIVADFGIATALQKAAVERITETGISLGSPTYMSPEQASGERTLDARTDIYSLACVLYEMLCGEAPLEKLSMQAMVTRKLTGSIPRLRDRRSDVPPALDAAIHKALASDPDARFASMREFSSAIGAAVRVRGGASRRAVWLVAAAAVVVVVVGGAWVRQERRVTRATQQIGEINRLASGGEFAAAFALAEQVVPIIPRDSTLQRVRPLFTDFIRIVTVPAGARVFRQHPRQPPGDWEPIGTTPLDSVPMPRFGSDLSYRLRIERDGYETAELLPNVFAGWGALWGVPALDTLRLDRAGAMPGMVRIPGWTTRDLMHPGGTIRLNDFHVGKHEVTNREYYQFVSAGGYQRREYWTEAFVRDGRELTWEEAMTDLRDRTGLPGPSTWSSGRFPAGQEEFPVGGVSYYEAAAYARFAGKRLPTAGHWSRAALYHHRESSWIYEPSSNLDGTEPRRVGQGMINSYGLHDIAGNVREWCVNLVDAGRLTRGGGWEDAGFFVPNLIPKPEFDRSPSNGFRLVALTDHDSTIAHLSARIVRPTRRDFRNVKAISDAEFSIYRRLFDYDPLPLAARRDTGGTSDILRWERVSFTAGYGGERMAAYVFLPRDAPPPYEVVMYWGPGGLATLRSFNADQWLTFNSLMGFIPRSGRALVMPVFKGTYDRDDKDFSVTNTFADSTARYRDLAVQWIKDLRRTVDYLETRQDMRLDRVGYYGYSWGGELAGLALTLEPRIKAAVLNVGGYSPAGPPRPEVDPVNYNPRARVPTLMLNGKHDVVFPYETSQLPFFQQLGTPPADKKQFIYPTGHSVPQEALVRESLAWFDRYLSGVGPTR
jgi:eukaryotic-like serine/threonine-protein kinase